MTDIKRPMAPMMPENMGENQAFSQPPVYPQKRGGWIGKVVTILVIVVVILAGLYLVSRYTKWNILNVNKEGASKVETTGWQAVFLSNGQVYFGRVTKQNEQMLVLKDIYYLQVAQSPQPAPEGQANQQQNLSLVKLGNELHGPKDAMAINMAHVLFTEELKSDSKVVDAIKRYLEEQQ